MKRGKPKRFFKESGKSTDELKDCDMLERDPYMFLCVEAEAAAVVLSRREEKLKLKKQKVKDQTGQTEGTPVNIENLKRKWGKWYFLARLRVDSTPQSVKHAQAGMSVSIKSNSPTGLQ